MTSEFKKIIISKENAVFWLDKDGYWHNRHGKFEHPKIIKYFHTSIRKDEGGYHVFQVHDEFEEKVYFKYEDTALFVFDIIKGDPIQLVLNTGQRMPLSPAQLFTRNDQLYLQTEAHTIKFSERVLIKLAPFMDGNDDDQLIIKINNSNYKIKQLQDQTCSS